MENYMIIKNQKKLYFFYKIYKQIPLYEMYRLRLARKSLFHILPFKSITVFGNWIFHIHKTKTIIIFETKYSPNVAKYIKKINPNSRIILFYWNTIADNARKSYLQDKNIDEFYTFDKKDAKKYKLNYNSQFYSNKIKLPKNEIQYDVFFIGRDKGRKKEILSLEKRMNKIGIKTKFIIVENEKDFISYQEYLNILSKSKVILDFVPSYQTGLSLRCMESIFFSKKLITNNNNIKEYDFYNKSNVFVIDSKFDSNKLKAFMKTPYKPIKKEMIDYYDFSSWIERFDK